MLRDCKGAYILILYLPHSSTVKSKAKVWFLEEGVYAYVGSAKRGIKARVLRYLSKNKKKHWHIDHLLEKAEIKRIFVLCEEEEQNIAALM